MIMRIVTVRRISQVFFFAMFLWFCIVSTIGDKIWQIRGWPINLFFQLDPLVAIGTALTTHTLYWMLALALPTVLMTIIFGRFFCGWVCPLGSLQQVVGFLSHRDKTTLEKLHLNKYRKTQSIKYLFLIFFLVMAAFPSIGVSLQTSLLDPISLITRSFNLALLPVLDRDVNFAFAANRFYEATWFVLALFLAVVFLNLAIPRFYCRFICPLGALFGVLDRFAPWRIGKAEKKCPDCGQCQRNCEGGCNPAGAIRISECVLCFNCRQDCPHQTIRYQTRISAAGEIDSPDISRRGFVISLVGGIFAIPAIRLGGKLAANWNNRLIRPPGSLAEEAFLKRCIKCGQCMRICPTNVIQPGGFEGGLETLWTPVLNNRIGSSGCQLNCVACSHICPTAAIRPITLSEKHGTGQFAAAGPIRLGTAFVDHGRCLPWSMDKPCIVCQENCPVSPKAIYTRTGFNTIRDGRLTIKRIDKRIIETVENSLQPDKLASGDYYCLLGLDKRAKIEANTENSIEIASADNFEQIAAVGDKIKIQISLQRPFVDIEKCIGCGICEHECPVSGQRAIRVSAEGETRSANRRLLADV
jgi:polyferredoxin